MLEVTVVGCKNLTDKERISKQDPYACVEYGSDKFKTRICKGGGTNPTFQLEKFNFTLIEGHQEINIIVWNHNTLRGDDFIGSGKVQLQRVISQGFDDSSWPLHTEKGRYAGEIKLIMRYQKLNEPATTAPPHPPYPPLAAYYPPGPSCPSAYPQVPVCPPLPIVPDPATYPAHAYPPQPAVYPPPTYPPPSCPPQPAVCHPPTYPPSSYPPEPAVYPPPTYPPTSSSHPSYPGN